MIVLECDNCERSFEVESRHAGGKVPCPHCGDVNRVPGDTEPAAEPAKRLGGKELPPDEGPEQEICAVHPAMARAHPFRFLAIGILLIGGGALAIWAATSETVANFWAWTGLLACLAGVIWWLACSQGGNHPPPHVRGPAQPRPQRGDQAVVSPTAHEGRLPRHLQLRPGRYRDRGAGSASALRAQGADRQLSRHVRFLHEGARVPGTRAA
ncbi:MAG: hypothetical protein ACYTA3_13125 [Planctomycetota bacterium]